MSKIDNEKEDEKFYSELDQDRVHGSCCTCQTLALLFIFILLILGVGSFYLYKQITSVKIAPLNSNLRTSFNDLTNRLNALKSADFSQTSITLSEQDLNAIMSGGLSVQNFILKDIQTAIVPEGVTIYGSLVKPLASKIVIDSNPVIENEKIKFKITSIKAGKLKLPKFIATTIENNFNQSLDTKFGLVYTKMTIEEVILGERELTMTGRLK